MGAAPSQVEPMDTERRENPRFDAILHLEYGRDATVMEEANSYDISLGGLFIVTHHPLDPGERMLVHLYLPDALYPIVADCEVVWTRTQEVEGKPPGMGVKFTEIEEEDLQRLELYFYACL